MTQAGARLLASVFRSQGIDAQITPPSDARTLELGAIYSSGEECFPEKITLGDFIKITETEGFDPKKAAFMMPAADGPCRFGQYWQLLERVLIDLKLEDVLILSPTSSDGYGSVGGVTFFKKCWVAVIASDILRKMLLKTRPYEKIKGTTDDVYEKSLVKAEKVFEQTDLSYSKLFQSVRETLVEARNDFRAIEAEYVKGKPLLAVVGEIYCRHNRFANDNMIRKLEEHGAETWLSDVEEWIYYTDWTRMSDLRRLDKKFSVEMAVIQLKKFVMKKEEHKLMEPFHDDFVGYEEPSDISQIMECAEPYLPPTGAHGEMVISIGKSVYSYTKGVDGIVDISPFSCMNGIITEAVYPSFSKDHNNIPCRVFYYDGVNIDLDRDIGIFMELVKGYMSRKKVERRYNKFFKD
jgi:predicted nucleotide-binding protein (sugar kinase/HSP70/actin superfamily)